MLNCCGSAPVVVSLHVFRRCSQSLWKNIFRPAKDSDSGYIDKLAVMSCTDIAPPKHSQTRTLITGGWRRGNDRKRAHTSVLFGKTSTK